MRKKPDGFTLMEVLVALVIFSIMATGFTRYVGDRAKQTAYLTDKTLAAIVASNAITQMQLSGQWPQVGRMAQPVSMADKNWLVDINVSATEQSSIRRLEVAVALPAETNEKKETQPLVTLVGFVEKPQ